MNIQPYIVVPNFIEQPTWGGTYISNFKNITHPSFEDKNIGQAYELYEHTRLSSKTSTQNSPSVELGDPHNPKQARLVAAQDTVTNLQQIINLDPVAVLGSKVYQKHGASMKVLIKFTQAKGNSYQIHIKQQHDGVDWLPKPESWYYLEPGVVTLGVKPDADWNEYKRVCHLINDKAKQISLQISTEQLTLEQGRQDLHQFIAENNPEQFVHRLTIGKGQVVDLSSCGTHHSWEEDQEAAPLGNIVYEVQLNVYDDQTTIRSFDKGKIKADGTIRPIHIDDYFTYIDRSPTANQPHNHFRQAKEIHRDSNLLVKQVFSCPDYAMQELEVMGSAGNLHTTTTDSFHHLFVSAGSVTLSTTQQDYTLTQGYSIFIPANTGQYTLKPGTHSATILKTYV